jgi:hypothetical protein
VFIQKSTFIFGLIKALVGWPELFHKTNEIVKRF